MAAIPASHLVLARKWRPERFDELVGQEHVTRTLIQALRSGRIAHAFLFTGIRGVGKTTGARILARCLNCEQGPTPDPCGSCAACLEIRSGGSLDAVEIDGATYRKIDDARAIIENLSYRPARDRFKIYIIDEAHQLTDQAFNALLKTLEEPPPHVKFILATTEPQKMPETILSRLQRYDFRRIPFATILTRLKELAGRESASADDAALSLLAREAGGSMRDAERMLETALASLDGNLTEGEIAGLLGVASRSRVLELMNATLDKDAAGALAGVRELHHRGANLESLGRDILEVLRNLAAAKLPGADSAQSPLADLPDHEAAELKRIAEKVSLRDLMRLFHLLAESQEQLLRSPYPDLILEMAVVRMATLAPVLDADELLRAIAGAGTGGASAPPAPAPATSSPPVSAGGETRLAAAETGDSGARRIPLRGEVKAQAPPRAAPIAPAQSAPLASNLDSGNQQDLPDLREFIRGRRAALAGFMEQGAGLSLAGDTIVVSPRNDIYIRYLSDNRTAIAELASELYGRRIRVEVASGRSVESVAASTLTAAASVEPPASSIAETAPPVPIPEETAGTAIAEPISVSSDPRRDAAEARQALYADPVVRRIFNEFEARLVEVRAAPRTRAALEELPTPKK